LHKIVDEKLVTITLGKNAGCLARVPPAKHIKCYLIKYKRGGGFPPPVI